jgi:hypothetical protein
MGKCELCGEKYCRAIVQKKDCAGKSFRESVESLFSDKGGGRRRGT